MSPSLPLLGSASAPQFTFCLVERHLLWRELGCLRSQVAASTEVAPGSSGSKVRTLTLCGPPECVVIRVPPPLPGGASGVAAPCASAARREVMLFSFNLSLSFLSLPPPQYIFIFKRMQGWKRSWVVYCLPGMHEALGPVPITATVNNKNNT